MGSGWHETFSVFCVSVCPCCLLWLCRRTSWLVTNVHIFKCQFRCLEYQANGWVSFYIDSIASVCNSIGILIYRKRININYAYCLWANVVFSRQRRLEYILYIWKSGSKKRQTKSNILLYGSVQDLFNLTHSCYVPHPQTVSIYACNCWYNIDKKTMNDMKSETWILFEREFEEHRINNSKGLTAPP